MKIALALLTIIDVIFIYASYIIDWEWAFMLYLVLGIAYLVFCGCAILCMCKTYRLRNKMERVLFIWSFAAFALLPIAYGINQARLYFFPSSVTFNLPDNEILKVAVDKIEWGMKDSLQTNYINLGEFNMNYSVAITKDDSLFVCPLELADSVHSRRFPVKGYETEKEFDEAISYNRIKWKYTYTYMIDGIHTGGSQYFYVPKQDSIDVHYRTVLNSQRIDKYDMIKDYRQAY